MRAQRTKGALWDPPARSLPRLRVLFPIRGSFAANTPTPGAQCFTGDVGQAEGQHHACSQGNYPRELSPPTLGIAAGQDGEPCYVRDVNCPHRAGANPAPGQPPALPRGRAAAGSA